MKFSVGLIDLSVYDSLAGDPERDHGVAVPCPEPYNTSRLTPQFIEAQETRREWLVENCSSWLEHRDNGTIRNLGIVKNDDQVLFIVYPLSLVDATMFLLRWG